MKNFIKLITSIVVGIFLTGFIHAGNKLEHTIKFATVAPEGSAWMKVMHEYDEAVRKATNGEVGFKFYAGGVGGDEKAVIRKIRFNQYHSAGFTGVGLGQILADVRILDAPMLFRNYEEVDHVLSKFTPEFEKKFEEKGYILLGWTEVGFVYVFSKKPLINRKTLSGAKMWTWEGDPVASATFGALEVTPVPLAITDVLTSLQTNLIDAAYTGPSACVALQWHTKVEYVTNLKLANAVGAVLISKKRFNRIPAEYQIILKDLGRQYMKKLTKISRADNAEALMLMEENGIKKVEVDKKDMPFFIEAGKKAREKMAGSLFGKDLLERLESAVAEVRDKKD
ncbi:MAG: TRAP transporter substrate-binding protein DctP [Calditrichia bacterium]|nr:TRAP transporter substrate-binding protein DctP [Calditrichia bacterium]